MAKNICLSDFVVIESKKVKEKGAGEELFLNKDSHRGHGSAGERGFRLCRATTQPRKGLPSVERAYSSSVILSHSRDDPFWGKISRR